MNTESLARQHGKPVQEQNAEVEYLFTLEGVEALLAAEREAILDTVNELMGSERERHPMFSEGHSYALESLQTFILARSTP